MKLDHLENYIRGWVAGSFDQTILKTDKFEAAVKYYKVGEYEPSHCHKLTSEINIVVSGHIRMNGKEYKAKEIIIIEPGEYTDFETLTETVMVVLRDGSVLGDKYFLNS